MIFVILLSASIASAEVPSGDEAGTSSPWAEFSRSVARRGPPATGAIGTLIVNPDGTIVYWAKRGDKISNSTRCPVISSVAEGIRSLHLPALSPKTDNIIVGDGTTYRLTVELQIDGDKVDIITSGSGHVGSWIDAALSKLETCWPKINRFE
ncbi:MAG: hypothetical protein EON58_08145 [Alphaproteobacteria bacterium]|nr:MAG: hypothetical protein EON58_08145 [Alphaproteobacteria bacterium]